VTTSIKLAEALWAGDLEYDSTNQAIWATGEYPPDEPPEEPPDVEGACRPYEPPTIEPPTIPGAGVE